MKKQNNRFRNGNNNCYTLNYKFDSVSIAGKISGTALDLIRRYNDLAKEAQSCGDYVDMEIYRQYAEHYRKIVTEINERRQYKSENANNENQASAEENQETEAENETTTETTGVKENEAIEPVPEANGYVETLPATEPMAKSFHVVEISENKEEKTETKPKAKRVYRKRTTATQASAAEA